MTGARQLVPENPLTCTAAEADRRDGSVLWYHSEKFAAPLVVAVPASGPAYAGVPSGSSAGPTMLASGWAPSAGRPKSAVRGTPLEEKDLMPAYRVKPSPAGADGHGVQPAWDQDT